MKGGICLLYDLTIKLKQTKHMKKLLLLVLSMSFLTMTQAQLRLDDIWSKGVYKAKTVPGFNFMNDGRHYTRLENNQIIQYDLTTGRASRTIFDGPANQKTGFQGNVSSYSFNEDESKILIASEEEAIYRRSRKAFFYIYDRAQRSLTAVFPEGKHSYATLNPQADKVAFVYQNNLYYKDLSTNEVVAVTKDGEINAIINGTTDWVYEEELSIVKGFEWSPDGQKLAYFRFDESEVKEFTLTNYREGLYPEYVTFKYPKVGETNADVSIHVYDLPQKKVILSGATDEQWEYIPRIKWTTKANELVVFFMNRHQNHLELQLWNTNNLKKSTLLEEKNQYYLNIHDNLTFLADGERFIWTSEKDGWNHVYLYNKRGKELAQLTRGKWDVTNFYGVDEEKELIYFQAASKNPMERELFQVGLNGKNQKLINDQAGYSNAQFSSTFDYYVLNQSDLNTPPSYTVFDRSNEKVRLIEDNYDLKNRLIKGGVQDAEFFSFKTKDKVELNGYMIKPKDFVPNFKYPVFMFLYGGPGSQQVVDNWRGDRFVWLQMLAQQGFVVAVVDNRGTGARGEEFKKMTYLQLGKYETEDQIEAAKYLGSLEYTDPSRIGIFGWSYGGYMSSLCLLKGGSTFKAAIAVAPVTNWKWYDSIYTERYMRTEAENADGYADNSPVNFAQNLRGDYLLVHGMGDDNVHFQHTAEMANALIKANKQYDTYFYPNRNHGIYGDNARLHLYQKMTDFIMEKLHKPNPLTKMKLNKSAGRNSTMFKRFPKSSKN
ncbi:MAG: S9 family peptidase [Saprospiraceae bacterium]